MRRHVEPVVTWDHACVFSLSPERMLPARVEGWRRPTLSSSRSS
jgi:hypothetical protein